MKSIRLCSLALAVFTTTAHSQSPNTFVTYEAFLANVASANAASYLGHAGATVESTDAFEDMRRHILWMYGSAQATHSFLLDSQYVDCIPIMQQPSVRLLGLTEIAAPPPPLPHVGAPPPVSLTPSPLTLGLSDEFGNAIQCAQGTIPMVRMTLERLTHFRTLREVFRKHPGGTAGASPAVNSLLFRHASVGQTVNNLGAETYLNVWYPPVNQNNGIQHSLSQMWVLGGTPGTPVQSAEVGWFYPWAFQGNIVSALFTYWTADGYVNTGCYNHDCPGFVQLSNTIVLGAPNWPGSSVAGGQQVVFEVEYAFYSGNWWLSHNCDACYVGYYPGSLYNGGQLSMFATELQFGGEGENDTGQNFPPIGSGAFASAGAGFAAYQNPVDYWTCFTGSGCGHIPILVKLQPQSACYTVGCTSWFCNYFYFGGPGGNSCP